ncbi:tRNA pseudouridine32 synthase / 23S rRNA pseudouridine746 synthase [Aeromicrobium choanae]|uniref:RNA pseudouridylate synthase n=2 Tax=Aeromicrobium choanae TaxID=1736691 RepID=A0A1T4Z7M6_9ACTN|nr:tRNA pseudouridine32 synthase / 23S rRNA pseudouridine746 synthase [Aeromicrobium choanae]
MRTPDRHQDGPPWPTMAAWLEHRLAAHADVGEMLADERLVYDDLRPVGADDPYAPHTFVWFHRDLRDEVEVPGEIRILHRDERIVVVDKPAFLSTIPRGQHVVQSVVVRLRAQLDLPELTPLHRLDRVTSGVLLMATERRWRGPYQTLFEHRRVSKTYRALAAWQAALESPVVVRNHLRKERGALRAEVVPDAPVNAETLVEMEARDGDLAVYRLSPRTGRTHQLRLHLAGLGSPIVGDPLYPTVTDASVDDFSRPLQLIASELRFTDPVDGADRRFVSDRTFPLRP